LRGAFFKPALHILSAGAVLALSCAIFNPSPALGADPSSDTARGAEKVRSLYEEGKEHYARGEFGRAIACFTEAYSRSNDAGLLFNIAQAHRKHGDCQDAARFYRSYLAERPTAADRARVERWIDEMDACVGAARSSQTATQAESRVKDATLVSTASAGPSSDIERKRGAVRENIASMSPNHEPGSSTWVPWALVGAGAVGVGAGLVVFETTARALAECRPRCSPDRISELRTRVAVAYTLMGIGGAATAIGLVLGLFTGASDPTVSLGWIAPAAPGLVAGGHF
jgi:hypothetical protein